MPPRSNVPIRIGGSKSRLGCRTCKQRHVKCDEHQPVCARCQKAGRQCIYDQPQSSTPPQASTHGRGNELKALVAPQNRGYVDSIHLFEGVSSFGTREPAEINAAQHFTIHLGKELAGLFSDEVWRQILPQVAQHEPAIWHGMVAVGMLDTSMRLKYNCPDDCLSTAPAIRHYTRALQELNLCLGSVRSARTKNVILLSCLLFAVFESLQNNIYSALQHISGGMKLMMEWESEPQSDHRDGTVGYLDHRSLQPMFFSLDSQAVQMGVVAFRDYFALPAIKSQMQIPTVFATAEEAHLVINQIFYRLSRWGHWIEPTEQYDNSPSEEWMLAEEHSLRTQLMEWDSAFSPLSTFSDTQASVLLLLTQRKVLQAFFDKQALGLTEITWDPVLPLFQEAVEYAEKYMEMTAVDRQFCTTGTQTRPGCANRRRPVFTVSMDIVMSLFSMSVKCRDSVTRWRALKMLKMCGRREGIWDSYLCAVVAEKLIELEENNASADGHIPENARVYGLDVRLGEGRMAKFTYKRLITDEDGGLRIETTEDSLTW